ncbi:MAG TPA: PHP domain-containing protein [Phototrophicaceae bacterium]|nr:PHP domain-containing protein [Phototrophicaceae bacterium]
MRIDLHLHTTASDGQLSPSALVRLAQSQRMDVIAVTDHDTTAGLPEAQQAATNRLLIIPGIELSAEDAKLDVHILGYFINTQDVAFQNRLTHFREDRLRRGEKIVARLAELGKPLAWERVLELAHGGAVGRPHVARAMIEAGYVESMEQAFGRYLHNRGPAYVARQRLTPEEAIALLHQAGGAAVLAHPGILTDYAAMIERLAPVGLDGVEVVHPLNPPQVRDNLRALALRHHLIVTGGSDFHRPDTENPIGSHMPPPTSAAALRDRAARYAKD